jgi:hypothetical protein
MRPSERNGPAPDRKPRRTASRRSVPERWLPSSRSGSGGGNAACSTDSSGRYTPVISSSLPPRGRSTSRSVSSLDSGRTTHSRPRVRTREPTSKLIYQAVLCSEAAVMAASGVEGENASTTSRQRCGESQVRSNRTWTPAALYRHDVQAASARISGCRNVDGSPDHVTTSSSRARVIAT